MIAETKLRQQIRAILATRREGQLTAEPFILAELTAFFSEPIPAADMMKALQWNEARGFADRRYNSDEERDEWILTERGRVKEGL